MKNLTAHQVVTAASLMAGALQAATIQSMIRKNVITDEEGHEIYEHALLMLEASQAQFCFARRIRGGARNDRAAPSQVSATTSGCNFDASRPTKPKFEIADILAEPVPRLGHHHREDVEQVLP